MGKIKIVNCRFLGVFHLIQLLLILYNSTLIQSQTDFGGPVHESDPFILSYTRHRLEKEKAKTSTPPVPVPIGVTSSTNRPLTFTESVEKPDPKDWIKGRNPSNKGNLISWLIDGCFFYKDDGGNSNLAKVKPCPFSMESPKTTIEKLPEFQTFDGFFNNIFKTDLGAIDTPLLRRVPSVYSDGAYEPPKRPINPFTVSESLMTRNITQEPTCSDSKTGDTIACGSKTGKSALLVYFGQQVVEELLDVQRPGCPPEYFNISIPKDLQHKFRGLSSMPLLRSRYIQSSGSAPGNPRQQLNEVTPWIDGGLVYGTSKAWADVLRTKSDGTLEEHGKLASDNEKRLFPVRNDVRLPMANPPPPAFHERWIKEQSTAKVGRFFVLGNPRGNENAFLLTFGIVLFRWHNHIAQYLYDSRGCRSNSTLKEECWSGERIFQEARKWVIATHSQILVYNWLPEWLGTELDKYKGYDPSVDPQIEQFYQTAAGRFGHTLVTPGVYLRDYTCNKCQPIRFEGLKNKGKVVNSSEEGFSFDKSVRTCNIYWRPQEPMILEYPVPEDCKDDGIEINNITDIDRLLMGMASQRAEREDNMIVEDLRGKVFGPLEFSRRDLMAINIQRGRDHGIPDYNTARESFNLPRIENYSHFKTATKSSTPDEIIKKLQNIHIAANGDDYDNPSDEAIKLAWERVDVWTGGILETSDSPGPLFREIIKDQFQRIRNADRFWFESTHWNPPRFTDEQIKRIKQLTIYDMLMSVTRMKIGDIQENPFRVPSSEDEEDHFPGPCRENSHWVTDSQCTRNETDFTCYHFPQLDSLDVTNVESCGDTKTFDYFHRSEIPFISTFIFLGVFIIGISSFLPLLAAHCQRKKVEETVKLQGQLRRSFKHMGKNIFPAKEWQGFREPSRQVILIVKDDNILELRAYTGDLLRSINLQRELLNVTSTSDGYIIKIENPKEYDCVVEFEGAFLRVAFLNILREKLGGIVDMKEHSSYMKSCLSSATTKEQRLATLEKFFKTVFNHAFKLNKPIGDKELVDPKIIKEVLTIELSKSEFAESLGMRLSSDFFQKMFNLVDRDKNGTINFREFLDFLVIFMSSGGDPEAKAKLMFDMYDPGGSGAISSEDFKLMIRSMIEAANAEVSISSEEMDTLFKTIISSIGLAPGSKVSLQHFMKLFSSHKDILSYAQLQFTGVKNVPEAKPSQAKPIKKANSEEEYSYIRSSVQTILSDQKDDPRREMISDQPQGIKTIAPSKKNPISVFIERNRLAVFWLSLYTLVVLAIFSERAYYYSKEQEHGGLRQIAGYGVTVTRGAASAMMFLYSTLLLTMCRNLITKLRETWLRKFVPFDMAIDMHKFIAIMALIFTMFHVIGHAINFYHISTQTPEDLSCLFREYFRPTHVLPKFQYWCYQTLTGITGVLLVLQMTMIYIFATQYARTHTFRMFWNTHATYPIFYILIFLHGLGRLVQAPLFGFFLIGPLFLFVFDRLVSIGRRNIEIPVIKSEILPSNVTKLEFGRPIDFEYKSGQWIRIACLDLNPNEYHPFTLSSSPHEKNLSLHIRAVGPFTANIRRVYERSLPKLYLDGPYGEGHQDWWRYEVSVLIGGGIGVTPFSSILKDVAANAKPKNCKKIYFIWVTRTQKQFEWFVECIREVEKSKLISVHVFITQLYNKFDLRTVILYICERHFQKVCNRSLFTGLHSVTHFGRPDFSAFLHDLKRIHPTVAKFGVFSCGPLPMIKRVDEACNEMNKNISGPIYHHSFENF